MSWRLPVFAIAMFALPPAGSGADVGYMDKVKPVLAERCYACHGALKQKAGLRLDTATLIHKGGKNGGILQGELLTRITSHSDDDRMPPEGKPLRPEEVQAIRDWIEAGAPLPEAEQGDQDPGSHWAFQKIERPDVPGENGAHPIDAFLSQSRDKRGLVAQSRAERPILLRRLYLSLTGLPPTRAQLADTRPWEEIVDSLLETYDHAEHWGRHWMDVWRYSDWYGLGDQLRNSQKHLWHWRDWIVESLHEDKGYDRMIVEMLAGDELEPDNLDVVRATGFLARNYYLFNRTTWLDSTIEHTGKAFLGLTMNCAKCHDHKYDPISQLDYYRFRALFEPHQVRLDPVPGNTDLEKDGLPRAFDDQLDAITWLHRRGDPKDPDKGINIAPGVPELFADFAPAIEPLELPVTAYSPGARDYYQEAILLEKERELDSATKALALEREKSLASGAPDTGANETAGGDSEEPVSDFAFEDEFDDRNETHWQFVGEDWEIRDGSLLKNTSSRENNLVVLKRQPPRDFELVVRYTTTGGTVYKSIGVLFDRSADGQSRHHVYTSAHEPEPKVQIAHTAKGKSDYPTSGKVRKPIKVGQEYELKFAVRDKLLNVWLDGEFLLAYNLPWRNPDGAVALSAFDATVAFDSVRIRALPAELQLKDTATKPEMAASSLEVARAKVRAAEAELGRVKAVIAADRAKLAGSAEVIKLSADAMRRQAEAEIAASELELAQAGADGGKRKAARDKVVKAQENLAKLDDSQVDYRPFRASRKALETPEHKFTTYDATYSSKSTGRRLALAKWIVHRDNPLTARVAVNHVWMRHLGTPLVETVEDFGRRAEEPVHRELLDWLAAELIESGWSLRHLHRLIVTSEVYRLSSSNLNAQPATLAADRENRYYWRMHPRRMESQVVRDSLLSLGGVLDSERGGPPVDPKSGGRRRGLYFTHSRDHKDKFMSMFDHADHLACYRRSESVMPQQALALSNAKLAIEMAGEIARTLGAESSEDEFSRQAFERILCRTPSEGEIQACLGFLSELKGLRKQTGMAGGELRARLVQALLNHNDFVTIR